MRSASVASPLHSVQDALNVDDFRFLPPWKRRVALKGSPTMARVGIITQNFSAYEQFAFSNPASLRTSPAENEYNDLLPPKSRLQHSTAGTNISSLAS
jgi:hypothetical protein